MSGPDRTQVLRIDCPGCHTKGYTEKDGLQSLCERCEGTGMLEKEVGYKFETRGHWSAEEKAEIFDMPVDEISDSGHDAPKTTGGVDD